MSGEEIVKQYGADALRLYELFIGPFAEPVPWSMNGLVGMRRFLEKVVEVGQRTERAEKTERVEVTRLLHQTIKKVSEDSEAMRFNTAVSQMMIFVNAVKEYGSITKESFVIFLRLLCPFAPHVANELFESLGGTELLETRAWPTYDEELAKEESVEIGVQVSGKIRGTIILSPTADESIAMELAKENSTIQKYLEGAQVKKVIYVPGKILNIVLG